MRTGIALGSNLGDRVENLQQAARAVRNLGVPATLTFSSSIYETAPVDCVPGTPSFLNAVVEIEYLRTPRELLQTLLDIERGMGRPQVRPKNLSRSIDLDILYMDDLISADPALHLPHPGLTGRAFVLAPLAEIRPDLILPGQHASVKDLLANSSQRAEVVRRNERLLE